MSEGQAMPAVGALGKFLLRDGVIGPEQLADALRQQVLVGGRLGTNLLELGYANHDQLAVALSNLHGVPAALIRHLRGADSRARKMIPEALLVELVCLPIAFATAGGRRLVVAMREPAEASLHRLQEAAHMDVVAAICPERTLYRLLAHYTGATLPARMSAQPREPSRPIPPGASGSFEAAVGRELLEASHLTAASSKMPSLALVELDHESARRDPTQIAGDAPLSLSALAEKLRAKRASKAASQLFARAFGSEPDESHLLDEAAHVHAPVPVEPASTKPLQPTKPPRPVRPKEPTAPNERAKPPEPTETTRRRPASSLSEALLGAVSESRLAAVLSRPADAGPAPLELDAALAQIASANQRSDVSDAIIAYLKTRFDAGLILVVNGDVAYGYRGFGGHFDDDSVETVLVPLTGVSPFQAAHAGNIRYLGAGGGGDRSLFGRFLKLFPLTAKPEICVVDPIAVRDRIICLVYAHAEVESTLGDDALENLSTVVDAVGDAFLRLIRAQQRE